MSEHAASAAASGVALRAAAEEYLCAGLCVLPAVRKEKRPAIATWKRHQSELPDRELVESWFPATGGPDALCLVCGTVSGHLEMIDFDNWDGGGGEAFEAWREAVEAAAPGLLERLVIETTPSGGRHVVYRCDTPVSGNTKLAQRRIVVDTDEPVVIGNKEYTPRRDPSGAWVVTITIIETRGEGGLFLCAPSPGYEVVQGDLRHVPVITDHERDVLLSRAWSLDEMPHQVVGTTSPADMPPAGLSHFSFRPGDDFNERGDPRHILLRHGWVLVTGGENEHWRRPGKSSGTSATLRSRVFYVFSTNATPFEAHKGYSPFAVYALLEHHGDFTAAASALGAEGYGSERRSHGVDLSCFFAGSQERPSAPLECDFLSAVQLKQRFPRLRNPVIHGLLRQGETMNVIASPKAGKSWLAIDLALSIASGTSWLNRFETSPGEVLIIDNELHRETSAHRVPQVAEARGVDLSIVGHRVLFEHVRGRLQDIMSLGSYAARIEHGRFKLIILDAFYRFMPAGVDENDNAALANIYNAVDQYADQFGCAFVLIHHSSKGNQSGKSVTDVGAGAGSQSRATDTHLVLRPHEQDGVVVLDAAVRSWPPLDPICLRWDFPVWSVDESVDPASLKPERSSKREAAPRRDKTGDSPWTVEKFVTRFISPEPVGKAEIRENATVEPGLSWRRVEDLLDIAESRGLIYRWRVGRAHKVLFATMPQPASGEEAGL